MNFVTITIVVHVESQQHVSEWSGAADTSLTSLVSEVLARHGQSGGARDWVLRFGGVWIEWEQSVWNLVKWAGSAEALMRMPLVILPRLGLKDEAEDEDEGTKRERFPTADSGLAKTMPPGSAPPTRSAPQAPPPPPMREGPRVAATLSAPEPDFRPTASKGEGWRGARSRDTGRMTAVKAPAVVERRASVRYYSRMNPERMYPLLIVLSKHAIQEVVKKHVAQQESEGFKVTLESVIEVEPVLPGCNCYPPKEYITVKEDKVQAEIWVVPHVLGKLIKPRVILRQGGKLLAEVPLTMQVVKQTMTVVMGLCSLVMPYVSMGLKRFQLDWQSQQERGFPLYSWLASEVLAALTPEVLGGALLLLTLLMYLWFRPRQRDVFWDIAEKE